MTKTVEKHVFIVGSKGIPAKYGGFETFVDELVTRKSTKKIQYYVSCLSNKNEVTTYNEAICFHVKVSQNIGSARSILYDIKSIQYVLDYIENNKLENTVLYILACRIGPFMKFFKKRADKLKVSVCLNPDGHEWKRSKWSYPIKKYWKFSEKLMLKYNDLTICDSLGIESYIQNEYSKLNVNTCFIPYGAEVQEKSSLKTDNLLNEKISEWKSSREIFKEYYLIVGRFVSENNYELIIREFMKSKTKKDLVIITNVENNSLYKNLVSKLKFENDKRIKFVGTLYDSKILSAIRYDAFGYIHGHSVGGTNPSLLEAMATTDINLLYDVNFNKEVGKDACIYFNQNENNLSEIINELDSVDPNHAQRLGGKSKRIIKNSYNWSDIVRNYEKTFLELKNK